jgi:hypothetical protein
MTGLLVGLKGFQEVNVQSYSLLKVSPLTDTQRLVAHLVRAISQTQSWIALSICTLPLLALSAFQHALPWYRIGMPNYRPSGWRGIFPQICAPCPLAGDFLAAAAPGLAFTSLLALGALGLVGLIVSGSLLLAVQGRTSVWVVTASLLMSMLGPVYLYASEQLIPPLAFPYPHLFAMPQLVPAIGLMLSSYLLTALILVAISRKL